MNGLLAQGLELMLYGMGFVLVFLVLLVVATTVMSALVRRFPGDEPADATPPAASAPVEAAEQEIPPQVVAAIREALHQHRARQP